MKPLLRLIHVLSLTAVMATTGVGQDAPATVPAKAPEPEQQRAVRERLTPEERQARRERRAQRRAQRANQDPAVRANQAPAETPPPAAQPAAGARPALEAVPAAPVAAAPAAPKIEEKADLRLNFRGVPLDMVLNYLSEAAGFIIVLETPLKGNVDVWSNQPLTRTEAVNLLNTVLDKNGYAAIQNERTLTIVGKEEARKRNVPVKTGSNPQGIPKNEEVVTQILPVRYISAPQLIRDLQALLPASATIASNEGGNAIVITDSQANIRRLAEIIAALDTTVSGTATLRVFPLKYADAKALATTIRDLFQDNSSGGTGRTGTTGGGGGNFGGRGGGGPGAFAAAMFGGGGFGGAGGGGRGGSSSSQGPAAAKRVVAVADEHSNSIIVSASEDFMATIAELIGKVDTDVQDLTELRVFTLKYSDPTEMADLLSNLFPDTTTRDDTRGGGFRFGGGGFPGGGGFQGGGNRQASTTASERTKKQGKVVAVADPRTSSVVVSAAKELMPQISAMVAQLDSNPAKKQKVYVYSLDNADATEVEGVLRNLFESQNSRNTSVNSQQNNALQNRANNANRQTGNNQLGGGFGGGGGLGGGGGGGGFR